MAVGTTTAVLLGLGAAGAGVAASKMNKPQPIAAPIPLPQSPTPEAAADKGAAISAKRRAANSQSIYTSPLGVTGQADIAKKQLLGQ